jgi:hypothetical protein
MIRSMLVRLRAWSGPWLAIYGVGAMAGLVLGLSVSSLLNPTLKPVAPEVATVLKPADGAQGAASRTGAPGLGNGSAEVLPPARTTDNPTTRENQQPGSNKWQLGLAGFRIADDATAQIVGYASATSINKGEAVNFYVSVTPVQTYTIDIYRVGWYGGRGGRLLQHIDPINGIHQPGCPPEASTGMIVCHWQPSYTLNVPTNWTSGIYLALLTNAKSYQNYIVFAVRDDQRAADLLYQQSVTTYQAYNNFPDDGKTGKSLYNYNSYGDNTISGNTRAVKVSFDRPYNYGAGQFMNWEINFVRWLERSGYDVAYSTDIDTHSAGERLRHYKAFLSVGHDEYWSKEMYDAVEAARDMGVNLAFFGADAISWQVRFEPSADGVSNRVIVCYKDAALDPVQNQTTTVDWRNQRIKRPEQSLIGIQYTSQLTNTSHLKNNAPYVITASSNWVYAQTGLKDGDSIPGLVGYESDRLVPNFPRPRNTSYTILSKSPFTTTGNIEDYSNAAVYQAPSGAWVFAAGTVSWSWGLDDYNNRGVVDPRIQRVTENILDRFVTKEQGHE